MLDVRPTFFTMSSFDTDCTFSVILSPNAPKLSYMRRRFGSDLGGSRESRGSL